MTSHRATWRKRSLIAYLVMVFVMILLDFLPIPWEENLAIVLGYYQQLSRYFFIGAFVLIVFRLLTLKHKGVPPETRKIRVLGPVFDLAVKPLFDASLFSSGLFMLYSIFQERAHGLSQDIFFVLSCVAIILLYLSFNGMIEMVREIFHVQTTEEVVRE